MKFKKTKQIIIKIDDFREEKLEDFIANDILKRFNELKNADNIRSAINLAIINAACAYATTYGLPAVSEDIKKQIDKEARKVEKSLNEKLQAQLNKKTKAYQNRHKELNIN